MPAIPSRLFLIALLGALSVISPFAIDMYLPGYAQVAADFGVAEAVISLTLSSYFIGLALGQIFYGPLLDRFGRKKPLYAGLGLFILSSIGCAFAPDIKTLIILRFLQAIGGCVAEVAALAMVRDFFPVKENAKILSLMFLFIALSPLLAPSAGGFVMLMASWRFVFLLMAIIVCIILALTIFFLPEGHQPDPGISLKPGPILREYWAILRHPRFATYGLSGAFSFAGLFTYVAGAPIIFMEGFGLNAHAFSAIFALLAMGFIGGSQLNILLLRRFDSEILFFHVLILQVITGFIFMLGSGAGWLDLYGTLALFFVFLGCAGLTYPNATALALAPFSRNAGSASALVGFLQMGIGALISTGISVSTSQDSLPIVILLAITSALGFSVLMFGRRAAHNSPMEE